jgi:predicted Zn finger-like uncharacterized protein
LKFLCDNCKAKYQIADEKVAGKTVRMKCRKCGHQIEVRAAVTETSVSTAPPVEHGAQRPAAKSSLATSLSAAKPRAPVHSASQGPASSALAGAFQRNVQDAPVSQPFPQHGSSAEISVTDEWYVAINGVPVGPVRISELRRKAASGAVTEDSLCWQEGLEEWRPVRSIPELAALVREAAQGNRPSLVSPAPNEGRASSPPRPPQRPSAPTGTRSPEPPHAAPYASPSREPPQQARPSAPSSPSRSNVVPLRVAASSNIDPLSGLSGNDGSPITSPLGGAAAARAPFLTPQPQPMFAQPQPQPQPPAPQMQMQMQMPPAPAPMSPISDPFAVPPGPAPQTASWLPPAPLGSYAQQGQQHAPSIPPPATKRGVPLWFWPILLFTGVFGVSAAVFVFKQQQPQPPVVIQMPATAPTAPEAKHDPAPADPAAPVPAAPSTGGGGAGGGGKVASKGGGPAPAAQPKPGGGGAGIDLGGLVPGAGGPAVGGGSGPGPSGGGQGLDSSSVERVVASHRAGVKRTCWERGGADQKGSVNVTVSAQVAPDGSVASTSSSGDDPVVAKCIESQVRTWRFNAPGSTTTVNIPFKFVRQ